MSWNTIDPKTNPKFLYRYECIFLYISFWKIFYWSSFAHTEQSRNILDQPRIFSVEYKSLFTMCLAFNSKNALWCIKQFKSGKAKGLQGKHYILKGYYLFFINFLFPRKLSPFYLNWYINPDVNDDNVRSWRPPHPNTLHGEFLGYRNSIIVCVPTREKGFNGVASALSHARPYFIFPSMFLPANLPLGVSIGRNTPG